MSEQQPQDQAARDLIENSLDRNVVIVAGAGAGKTTAIVNRMIALVREGKASAAEIAAITFTRKAAGELRNRFIDTLHSSLSSSDTVSDDDSAVTNRIREALSQSDSTFAGTIHAFCAQLLRERSFAVGLQPDFTEIDEREEKILRRRVWNEFLHTRQLDGDEHLQTVQELDIGVDRLFYFFSEANEFRDIPLKNGSNELPDLSSAVNSVRDFVDEIAAAAPRTFDIEKDPLMRGYLKARHFLRNRSMDSPARQVEFLEIFSTLQYRNIKPENWFDPVFASRMKKGDFKEFRDEIVNPALARWGEYVYAAILPLIEDAVLYYQEERRKEGVVSFDDLLFYATMLLRKSPEARRHFATKYRYLFVDEFQDTDPIQAELIFLLTAENPEEARWEHVVPRPGSLCIVGDEKQAIYRFRRADVETFRFAAQRIDETGGERIELTTSFRSLGNLCDWYNSVFSTILSSDEGRYQARFLPLEKFRPDGYDRHCVRKLVIPKVPGNKAAGIAELEASRIARFISAALKGQTSLNGSDENAPLAEAAQPGDFMILVRKNANLAIFSQQLQRYGIPFDIVGGNTVGTSQEFKDLVHVLRAIYEPDNPLWILSYLRGNLNGFNDQELYDFVRAGGRLSLYPDVPDSLSDELKTRLTASFNRLINCSKFLNQYPPRTAIERIVDELGMLPFAASIDNGSTRAGTILRVLDMIRKWEIDGMHWGEIVEELIGLVDDPQSNLFESTLEAGGQNVVRLMNVHQSKGLQARVVILADTYNMIKSRVRRHVSRMSVPPYVSIRVVEPKANYDLVISQPPGWTEDEAEELLFEEAEEKRILYVAATRARNMLIISQYPDKMDRGQWHLLYGGLQSVPELRVEDLAPPRSDTGDTPSLSDLVATRDAAVASARAPTYEMQTVTRDEEEEHLRIDGPTGFGADYGTAVHHLLELEVRGALPDDVGRYVDSLTDQYPGLPGLKSRLLSAVDRFRTSALSDLISRSHRTFAEVPIGWFEVSSNIVHRGKIDLVLETDDGWMIVDYKSTVATSTDDESVIVGRHADQLHAYAAFWEEATGERVTSCSIFLTETGTILPVPTRERGVGAPVD